MSAEIGTLRSVDPDLILVVDDDIFFRESIASFLKRRHFATLEAGDGESALELAVRYKPLAALIDVVLPEHPHDKARKEHSFGVELARQLKRTDPMMAVVLLSAYGDRSDAVLKLAAEGVRGLAYLIKGYRTGTAALLRALEETRAGHVMIQANEPNQTASLAERFWARLTPEERGFVRRAVELFPTLSPREREIAYAFAHAQTIEGVATDLNISVPTVEKHVNHIYSKLELDRMALRQSPLRKSLLLAKACWLLDLLGGEEKDNAHLVT